VRAGGRRREAPLALRLGVTGSCGLLSSLLWGSAQRSQVPPRAAQAVRDPIDGRLRRASADRLPTPRGKIACTLRKMRLERLSCGRFHVEPSSGLSPPDSSGGSCSPHGERRSLTELVPPSSAALAGRYERCHTYSHRNQDEARERDEPVVRRLGLPGGVGDDDDCARRGL
jgi:hypothetical protein